jgi:hypothetical protein
MPQPDNAGIRPSDEGVPFSGAPHTRVRFLLVFVAGHGIGKVDSRATSAGRQVKKV